DHVGGGVRGAQARGLDGVREHHLAAEPDDPRQHRDRTDQQGRAAYPRAPRPRTPPFGDGRAHPADSGGRPPETPRDWGDSIPPHPPGGPRPSMSPPFSPGRRARTFGKLTFSLPPVLPPVPASSAPTAARDTPPPAAPGREP